MPSAVALRIPTLEILEERIFPALLASRTASGTGAVATPRHRGDAQLPGGKKWEAVAMLHQTGKSDSGYCRKFGMCK